MKFQQFIFELKERNVLKSCMAYIVSSWVLIQFLAIILPTFDISKSVLKTVFLLLLVGFPICFLFSWHYEITATGIIKHNKKTDELNEETKKSGLLDKIIAGGIVIIVVLLLYSLFGPTNSSHADDNVIIEQSVEDKSIAVLAFADMSPNKDQEHFSDGISEEILNLLTKVPSLKVISRTSSFSFKEKEATTEEIGQALNVKNLLDGSIRKSGSTFRISTQLIDTENGEQLWSETYDRPMDDIFKIQDEIAAVVLQQLKVSLLGEDINSKTVDSEAYNLYLEAKLLREYRDAESDSIAEALIKESISLDDSYAPSYALLSELIYNGGFSYSRYTIPEATSRGIEAARKSLELDPNYALAHTAIATFDRAIWDFKSADQNLRKALMLDPENVDVIYESASNALDVGRLDDAIGFLNKAIILDPVNYVLDYTSGLYYLWNEEYNLAEEAMNKYVQMNPNSGFGHNFLAQIYLKQGRNEKALEALGKDDDPYWSLYRKSIVYFELKDFENADASLSEFIDKFKDEGWPNIAHIYACRKQSDEVFKWLELAYENRDPSLLEILNYPEFTNVHQDPRWTDFINKLGLPADHGFYVK